MGTAIQERKKPLKILPLHTEEYLKERAKLGNRSKFEKALSQIADIEPDEIKQA
jgi:hypothetical protein